MYTLNIFYNNIYMNLKNIKILRNVKKNIIKYGVKLKIY